MIPSGLANPPFEFGPIPFWFWNDALSVDEILRQIQEFQQHGVSGFVIHPRVGLPRDLGWMSDRLLDFYQVAIDEAQRRQMTVMLYDEGMYPSGSASGLVVAENPAFACRCLAKVDVAAGQRLVLQPGENLVAVFPRGDVTSIAVIDRPANSVIRGLHYIGEGPREDEPPAADILNPLAVEAFIRLVYEKFAERFSEYFGGTIQAIFTDEPGLLGRSRERDIFPGTTGILEHASRILGYDFSPHLPALWDETEPGVARFRWDYAHAVSLRLEETYYQPLSSWCEAHDLALTGHPHKGDDLGPLRYFHIPGQDLVWRWVLPDQPSALEGVESTQAKCSSSAMLHGGRRRNANECCGAYGHEMTWEEMNWLVRWAFVRGVNLLIPHAFYYSVRGLRWDERPPDVGPNSPWWGRFPEFALVCRRLSWINTDAQHVCSLAILGQADFLPWRSAKTCFCNQYDFNYLEERYILGKTVVDEGGIHIAGMHYTALILEHEPPEEVMESLASLARAGRIFRYTEWMSESDLLIWLKGVLPLDLKVSPAAPALRMRHVIKEGMHFYLLFNEGKAPISVRIEIPSSGNWDLYDVAEGFSEPLHADRMLYLEGYELIIMMSEYIHNG
jgi:hypothetical protein